MYYLSSGGSFFVVVKLSDKHSRVVHVGANRSGVFESRQLALTEPRVTCPRATRLEGELSGTHSFTFYF